MGCEDPRAQAGHVACNAEKHHWKALSTLRNASGGKAPIPRYDGGRIPRVELFEALAGAKLTADHPLLARQADIKKLVDKVASGRAKYFVIVVLSTKENLKHLDRLKLPDGCMIVGVEHPPAEGQHAALGALYPAVLPDVANAVSDVEHDYLRSCTATP